MYVVTGQLSMHHLTWMIVVIVESKVTLMVYVMVAVQQLKDVRNLKALQYLKVHVLKEQIQYHFNGVQLV